MQAPQITADELRTAGHVLIGFAGILVTAIGFLIRTAYKMGQDAQKVATSLESLTTIKLATDKIPVIEKRLEISEEAWRQSRSDIKHLLRGSRPDYSPPNGEDPG